MNIKTISKQNLDELDIEEGSHPDVIRLEKIIHSCKLKNIVISTESVVSTTERFPQ